MYFGRKPVNLTSTNDKTYGFITCQLRKYAANSFKKRKPFRSGKFSPQVSQGIYLSCVAEGKPFICVLYARGIFNRSK